MDAEKMMMQRRIDNLMEQLELVKRQRDAAVSDLKSTRSCRNCKNASKEPSEKPCSTCGIAGLNYEWRGLCKETGGVEDA